MGCAEGRSPGARPFGELRAGSEPAEGPGVREPAQSIVEGVSLRYELSPLPSHAVAIHNAGKPVGAQDKAVERPLPLDWALHQKVECGGVVRYGLRPTHHERYSTVRPE